MPYSIVYHALREAWRDYWMYKSLGDEQSAEITRLTILTITKALRVAEKK